MTTDTPGAAGLPAENAKLATLIAAMKYYREPFEKFAPDHPQRNRKPSVR